MEWPLLRGVPAEDARRVLAAAKRRTFARNEVLFHEGDPADTIHLIGKGRVAARITTPQGHMATLEVIGPGDFVGELALLRTDSIRSATVIALEPTETISIRKTDFDELRRQHPSVTDVLIQILAKRVRDLSGQLVEALFVAADVRVLRRLLALGTVYGDTQSPVVVPLTQEDLAGLAGTTRATVNRVLRAEQQRGTVQLGRGKITVVDPGALARRAR